MSLWYFWSARDQNTTVVLKHITTSLQQQIYPLLDFCSARVANLSAVMNKHVVWARATLDAVLKVTIFYSMVVTLVTCTIVVWGQVGDKYICLWSRSTTVVGEDHHTDVYI